MQKVNESQNEADELRQSQQKLRELQLKRDKGKTFGSDYKDPCQQVGVFCNMFHSC
jgi:hypothetical protein